MSDSNAQPPEIMKAIEISEHGGPEVLTLTERPTPQPGPHDVLVRIAASGVNRPDVLQRKGLYPPPPGASDLPGLEAAGEIVAIGNKVDRWKIGDKVCALLTGGGYAEYAIAHEGSCLPAPKKLSIEEAAALPETVFTVWANVFDDAGLKAEETLLVHGATSGIGVMAIALGKAIGAKVYATAGTREKCNAAKELGADACFHYGEDKWEEEIVALGGADVVLDMAGGDFLPRNLTCLNPGGRHVSIAFLRGIEGSINIFAVMQKQLQISGSTMKARSFDEKARLAKDIEQTVWPLIEAGTITPKVDRILPLSMAAEAHETMEKGVHIGKILLKPGG